MTLAYNTETGYKAITTGNITEIYDMGGGTHEYMASYIDASLESSGFTTESISNYDLKYFDVYSSDSTATSYYNRILGDATGEMGPFYNYSDKDENNRLHNNWYSNSSSFVQSSAFWFYRGGAYIDGILAGQFFFNRTTGDFGSNLGSRLVLIG